MFILQDQTATTALEEDVISAGMEMSGKTVAKNSSLRVQLKMLGMHLEAVIMQAPPRTLSFHIIIIYAIFPDSTMGRRPPFSARHLVDVVPHIAWCLHNARPRTCLLDGRDLRVLEGAPKLREPLFRQDANT
jgi:hypothetical protein